MEAIRHRSILSMKSFPAVKNEKKNKQFFAVDVFQVIDNYKKLSRAQFCYFC